MIKVRPYLPLLGFLVPTLAIGYGVVIPRSCIAGVNALSVGFGTTVLGAALTYLAGQRAVLPRTACTTAPLLVRINRAINRQAAAPKGLFGRLLGAIWRAEHSRLNAEVLDRLDVRPGHRVLEIGSGPGDALHQAARRTHGGNVVGIDVSELMVRLARRRNRHGVARGEVEVRVQDRARLELEGQTFDRIFSVHSIYFWPDVQCTLNELSHALLPDGKLVLAFRPEGDDIPARFRDPSYRFPRADEVEAALRRAGLVDVVTARAATASNVVLVIARR